MKIFSIIGWSGSGKTTLITRVIKHYKARHKKVIAVKHAPHKYYLEPEATDTFKFLAAGADETCLVAKNEMLSMKHITEKTDPIALLESQYPDCDILLLEGLQNENTPAIEVFDSNKNETLKFPMASLCAVVSDKPTATDGPIPNFNINDIDAIIHFMEAYNE
ncbi:MAG: molybdopterin-guanine dinucleotide biosynthesis protein B [Candidatus Aminicenantes bacterium]|nr:molybdopterin-guanine dinucleotide biosynthesis protein B [Candidatus Aminicenantes bacterium]